MRRSGPDPNEELSGIIVGSAAHQSCVIVLIEDEIRALRVCRALGVLVPSGEDFKQIGRK